MLIRGFFVAYFLFLAVHLLVRARTFGRPVHGMCRLLGHEDDLWIDLGSVEEKGRFVRWVGKGILFR